MICNTHHDVRVHFGEHVWWMVGVFTVRLQHAQPCRAATATMFRTSVEASDKISAQNVRGTLHAAVQRLRHHHHSVRPSFASAVLWRCSRSTQYPGSPSGPQRQRPRPRRRGYHDGPTMVSPFSTCSSTSSSSRRSSSWYGLLRTTWPLCTLKTSTRGWPRICASLYSWYVTTNIIVL